MKREPLPCSPDDRRLPRHVAHLHTGLTWGGGEYQVLHLVRASTAAGLATSLWARSGSVLLDRARRLDLPARDLPRGWQRPLGMRPLVRDFAETGVDLLHCHDSGALGLGLRLRRKLHLPLVLARRIASPLRRNPISRAKYSARRIDQVVAVSNAVRDVLGRSGFPHDRITVVPSGLDVAGLEALARDEAFRRQLGAPYLVAGIGALTPKKNWPFLIRTAAAVAAGGLDALWLLVGEGPERSRLERLACELGASSRIRWMGFRDDAAQILKNCDLLFFPSVREGAAGTVRQAMVLGVPVVAVNSAGVVETLGGHGRVVAPGDVAGAAGAVVEVLTDAESRGAVCRKARQSALERFGFERTFAGTLDVYREVMARPVSTLRGRPATSP